MLPLDTLRAGMNCAGDLGLEGAHIQTSSHPSLQRSQRSTSFQPVRYELHCTDSSVLTPRARTTAPGTEHLCPCTPSRPVPESLSQPAAGQRVRRSRRLGFRGSGSCAPTQKGQTHSHRPHHRLTWRATCAAIPPPGSAQTREKPPATKR